MKLRVWQKECINSALKQYLSGQRHFLTLATPGAGKTMMASVLADQLLKSDLVDLVICFSPATIVSKDFCESLQLSTQERFDGLMGAKGRSLTYQCLQYLDDEFWSLFSRFRVFVIFDEIHHCSGSSVDNANSWGEQIILNIQDKAEYTLALTGTPWRSDASPIVLSNYSSSNNQISCDYIYGLCDAITDGVCRVPQIVAVDNNQISVTNDEETKTFSSFKCLLSQSVIPYQEVIENEDVINYVLSTAYKKLNKIRIINPDAAGLIVASSVEHAKQIAHLLQSNFKVSVTVVTYRESDATKVIQQFRSDSTPWIISVGMISEGTNIPRLQICCHLTNIKTEMHFRQILGRILRITTAKSQEAFLYMPAEPKLLEYAHRIKKDIPFEASVVEFEKMNDRKSISLKNKPSNEITFNKEVSANKALLGRKNLSLNGVEGVIAHESLSSAALISDQHFLTNNYEKIINVFGRFKHESIAIGLSELR